MPIVKLVSREFKIENTCVKAGNVVFDNGNFPVIAGPCAVESEKQVLSIAQSVKNAGAQIFRSGPLSQGHLHTLFRVLGNRVLNYWQKSNRRLLFPLQPKAWMLKILTLLKSMLILFR